MEYYIFVLILCLLWIILVVVDINDRNGRYIFYWIEGKVI